MKKIYKQPKCNIITISGNILCCSKKLNFDSDEENGGDGFETLSNSQSDMDLWGNANNIWE